MVSMVFSRMPPVAPFQPAWAAPMTPACRSREEYRAAIGREYAQGKAWNIRDDSIGLGALAVPRLAHDQHVARMRLVRRCDEFSARAKVSRHQRAIGQNRVAVVRRAEAGIEARVKAGGHSALAGKEAVRHSATRHPGLRQVTGSSAVIVVHSEYAALHGRESASAKTACQSPQGGV